MESSTVWCNEDEEHISQSFHTYIRI